MNKYLPYTIPVYTLYADQLQSINKCQFITFEGLSTGFLTTHHFVQHKQMFICTLVSHTISTNLLLMHGINMKYGAFYNEESNTFVYALYNANIIFFVIDLPLCQAIHKIHGHSNNPPNIHSSIL